MHRRSIVEVLTGAVVLLRGGRLPRLRGRAFRTHHGLRLYRSTRSSTTSTAWAWAPMCGWPASRSGSVEQERIDPKSFQAVVSLSVRDDIKLPKDSAAIISSESLLGGKYLSLQPGGDGTILQPGQTITITQGSVSLEDLLGKFIFSMTNAPKPVARPSRWDTEAMISAASHRLAAIRRRPGFLSREAAHAWREPRRTGAGSAGCV